MKNAVSYMWDVTVPGISSSSLTTVSEWPGGLREVPFFTTRGGLLELD